MQNILLVFTLGYLLLLLTSGCQPPPNLADMESPSKQETAKVATLLSGKNGLFSTRKILDQLTYQQMAKDFPNRVKTRTLVIHPNQY